MKILFINTLYAPHIIGGAEIILKSLVESVANQGHDVCVLTTGAENGIHSEIIDGVKVVRVGIKNIYWTYKPGPKKLYQKLFWHMRDIYNLSMAKMVEKVIIDFKPDVINAHNIVGFSSSVWPLIKKHDIPLVQVLHDQYAICPNSNMFKDGKRCASQCGQCKIFRLPHKALSNHVDAVIGVSNFVLQHHLKNGLFSNAKIKIPIINAKKFNVSTFERMRPAQSKVRFGYIGGLVPAKGIELLLKNFSQLTDIKNISLSVAGSGTSEYVERLKKYEDNNIKFIGYTSPDDFFKNIDVLIVPSLWNDTLPTVVFEAFVYGVPVIGSNRGGIPEMINHRENGFLFDPDDIDELKNIVRELSHKPDMLDLMRKSALNSSSRFVDIESWINEYINIFSKIIIEKKLKNSC